MQIGKTYHIYNGFAETLESIWFNDAQLISATTFGNGTETLSFETPNGKTITIDSDLMYPWDHNKKSRKGYMFIPAQTQSSNI